MLPNLTLCLSTAFTHPPLLTSASQDCVLHLCYVASRRVSAGFFLVCDLNISHVFPSRQVIILIF